MRVVTTDRRDLRRRTYDAVDAAQNPHGWRFRLTSGAILVTWDYATLVRVDPCCAKGATEPPEIHAVLGCAP